MRSFIKGRLILVRMILLIAVLALLTVGIATIYAVEHPADADEDAQNREWADFLKIF